MNLEPRDVAPPLDLEERTVSALHREGLLISAAARRRRVWQSVAAAAIFAAGVALGRTSTAPAVVLAPGASSASFLFLLEGGPVARDAAEEARTVEEYRAWAVKLRDEGRAVSGERLNDVRGFFVISAASLEEANQLARASPHAQRGGRVIVRPINPS
jgi:hypothetical protein